MSFPVSKGSIFDIDRLFDHFWAPAGKSELAESGIFAPRVDIKELKDGYEITAELPGVNKDAISVTVQEGVLTLSAEASEEKKEEKEGKVIRQERRYGKYMRSFNLGGDIHEDNISATFENGVLHLKVPKAAEKAPQQRRITVS